MSDFEIINKESVEFNFDEEDFAIIFEEGIWFARHNNEDLFPDLTIIEDKKNNILFEEDMEIFDSGFILTKEIFENYKKIVGEK